MTDYDLQAREKLCSPLMVLIITKKNPLMPPQGGFNYSRYSLPLTFTIYHGRKHIITISLDKMSPDKFDILEKLDTALVPYTKTASPEIEIIDVRLYGQPLYIERTMPLLIESGIIFLPITDHPSSMLKILYRQIHGTDFPEKHWKEVQCTGMVMIHQRGGFHVSYRKNTTSVMHIWQVGVLSSARRTGVFKSLNEAFLRTLELNGDKTYTIKTYPERFPDMYKILKKIKLREPEKYEYDDLGNKMCRFEIYVK